MLYRLLLVLPGLAAPSFLMCHSGPAGEERVECGEADGYRTCYTSYDRAGAVIERGCSTVDRVCVSEHSVQSRHLGRQPQSHIVIIAFFPDGFLSGRACDRKERVGHLLRGRDCENQLVEPDNTFQRVCYCRYHYCNHPTRYYSAGHHSAPLPALIILAYLAFTI